MEIKTIYSCIIYYAYLLEHVLFNLFEVFFTLFDEYFNEYLLFFLFYEDSYTYFYESDKKYLLNN